MPFDILCVIERYPFFNTLSRNQSVKTNQTERSMLVYIISYRICRELLPTLAMILLLAVITACSASADRDDDGIADGR